MKWQKALLGSLLIVAAQLTTGQTETDEHRPACKTDSCAKVKSYLKANYCGESPFGNGPDDGCEILAAAKRSTSLEVIADADCKWSNEENDVVCRQQGEPPAAIRASVTQEMRRLGLPMGKDKAIGFTVLKSPLAAWSAVEGGYTRVAGENRTYCQVVLVRYDNSRIIVLRKHRCETSNVDFGAGISWSILGIEDTNGDGEPELILEGDAYENHWLEVISLRGTSARTIFSGLGYYL